ncbi:MULTISPECIES: phage tail assembly chaperone [Burkholderia cepacia complex]|uniref:XkdW family protein n=1 Tax=Burkholderia cepacia complex TaxID=87882 RepID=UPI001906000A|nr:MULTISPECIES: phage tail assembly chaperone [Burkholderia cepacia complex]MBJ9727528.1 phage tail assembly chaperone [Burkholderia cenocepacia]MDN7533668.1 phage tail assembly chaperone [Burkholderia orbicola]
MKNNTMLHVEQAAFILAKKFPQLVRCKDYWVAHPVNEQTYEQTKTAWVPIWMPTDISPPTPADLLRWWPEFQEEFELTEAAASVRRRRDELLAQVDPLVERAADSGQAELEAALRRYRAELRDVPQQTGFPLDVVWPQSPVPLN